MRPAEGNLTCLNVRVGALARRYTFVEMFMKHWLTLEYENTQRRGKPGGRRRRTVKVLPGPDRWNGHPWRLARAALEPEAHRLRPEGLSLSTTFEGIRARNNWLARG